MAFLGYLLDHWSTYTVFLEVFIVIFISLVILYSYEKRPSRAGSIDDQYNPRGVWSISVGTVFRKDLWEAFRGAIHPGWLLGFRAIAFIYLLTSSIIRGVQWGAMEFFYYYTEWTLTLLVVYFAFATWVSASALFSRIRNGSHTVEQVIDTESRYPVLRSVSSLGADQERQTIEPGSLTDKVKTWWYTHTNSLGREEAGGLGYALQTVFEVVAPAVLLTDGVYWIVLYPSFPEFYPSTSVNALDEHLMNAIFLLGEFFLNSLPFPWYRGAYFALFTGLYTFFQWIIHGLGWVNRPYPYPFMQLDTPSAPLWYLLIAVAHIVCTLLCLLLVTAKRQVYMRISVSGAAERREGAKKPLLEEASP